jgi:PAS domain S-box-containing protein
MPLFAESDGYRLAECLRHLRQQPFLAYGIALAAFALATLGRWAIEGYVPGRIPFIFYFPAVVIASLFGGIGPGVFVAILSGITAWLAFMPVHQALGEKFAVLFAFGAASLLLVALVAALNWALDKILIEVEQRRNGDLAKVRLAAIVESSEDAMITKDLNGIITSWNAGAERLFGYSRVEVIGKPVSILIPSDRVDEEANILQRIRSGERVDHYETVRRRKDGSLIDISLTVSPLKDVTGKIAGASKVARDITERKRAAEQRDLLTKEMGHRVKNCFAIFRSLVTLSARSANTTEEMAEKLEARLTALARAHDLTRPGLLGVETKAAKPLTWRQLVHAILSPYIASIDQNRFVIKGTDLPIAENSLTGLALVLHELATNAAKCGSLSTPNGSVRIDTKIVDSLFLMNWEETGGPPLNGPPDHEGFGSSLAHQIIIGQFGGQLSYDWNRAGIVVRLSAPKDRIEG